MKKIQSQIEIVQKKERQIQDLTQYSLSLEQIKPGIYESDDIELILSHPLKNFGHEDIVIFDIDEVLITPRLDPFWFEHVKKESSLYKEFLSQEQHIRDKFSLYLFVSQSLSTIQLMDERTPMLIKKLQLQGVKCVGNTGLDPVFGSNLNFDSASSRVALLRDFGIDFSCAFPHLSSWTFDTLDQTHITARTPLFKEGIVFSPEVPKYITQNELFNRLEIAPKRLVFIDDRIENVQGMYNFINSLGIECYSFCYSKNKTKPLLSYFSDEIFEKELIKSEEFVKKLLGGEDVNKFYLEAYSGKFISHLNIEPGWTLGHKGKLEEKEHKDDSNSDSNLSWFTQKVLTFIGLVGTGAYILYKIFSQDTSDSCTLVSDVSFDTPVIGDVTTNIDL